jgi:cytochrome c peroxidase
MPELPADNPLTVEGVVLGERLFHEARLSLRRNQSCADCHQPAHGFSDPRPVSLGTAEQAGTRNAPSLRNLAWHRRFAWDGRRERLRDAATAPISDDREMALPLDQAVARLAGDAEYREQFARAFGGEVTSERIGLALEQFLLTRTAAESKFDRVLRGEAQLSEEEAQGFALFHTEYDPAHGKRGADCFHCHGGFDFSDHAFHDTGLGGGDPGRLNATGREEDRGKFKTPTLRDLAHTAPYFHDGRARTIEEAVAHYDHEVQRTANLDPNLAKRGRLGLSASEQKTLVAFLRTLTEEAP